jgi:hypothetical protein
MVRLNVFAVAILLPVLVSACGPSAPIPPPGEVETIVAQTVQALTPLASPVATPTPAPPSSYLLPHTLYYLSHDRAGLLQVFRLEQDGRSAHQVTFEPVAVDMFDISPRDGSVVYISNNQMLLVDASGAGRRVLLDGGPLNSDNRLTNSVGVPVWAPDGKTIAFAHGGLDFYALDTGAISQVLANDFDTSAGFLLVRAIYSPVKYSPDGGKLLINIGYTESGTMGIYFFSSNTLIKLNRPDGGMFCCIPAWTPDGSGIYAASPNMGMIDSGLLYADASSGEVSILLPGSVPDGTYNFADTTQVGPDGQLYFFFNNLMEIPAAAHTPLYMVRSGPDGVTGRVQLRPDAFENINEILWAPNASFAILALAPAPDVYEGGQMVIVYPDGRPNVALTDYGDMLKWGP